MPRGYKLAGALAAGLFVIWVAVILTPATRYDFWAWYYCDVAAPSVSSNQNCTLNRNLAEEQHDPDKAARERERAVEEIRRGQYYNWYR